MNSSRSSTWLPEALGHSTVCHKGTAADVCVCECGLAHCCATGFYSTLLSHAHTARTHERNKTKTRKLRRHFGPKKYALSGSIVFPSTVASTVSAMTAEGAFSRTHTEVLQKFHPFVQLPAFNYDAHNHSGVLRCLNTKCGRFSLFPVYTTWKSARSQLGYRFHVDWKIPVCPFCHPNQDTASYGHFWSECFPWDAHPLPCGPPGFPLAPPQPYQQAKASGPPGPAKAKAKASISN